MSVPLFDPAAVPDVVPDTAAPFVIVIVLPLLCWLFRVLARWLQDVEELHIVRRRR